MELKRYKLGEICPEFHAGNGIQSSQIKGSGLYPVFGGNGLRGYTDTFNQDGQYLIIGRQGAYCGNVRYNVGKAFLTEHAIVGQTSAEHNAIYLACKLSLMNLAQFQGQSAQPGLSVKNLSEIEILMPPKKIQDNIARVILNIDHKIALNRAINQNLEAFAKQLYDYWFVQFDFPNEEDKPYKSSGGAMAWNEALKRNIPKGWHCGNLFEIAKFTNGLACQKFRPKAGETPLPVIKIREMRDGFTADTEEVTPNIPDSVKVFNGDILFSWSASLEVMLWAFGEGGLNQHIFKVTSANGFPKSFYYYQLLDYVDVFKKMAEARKTTMGHITQDHLQQSTIAIPDDKKIADEFEKRISPIFEQMVKLQEEILALTKLRNELLPLLMNGQVSLNSDLSHD